MQARGSLVSGEAATIYVDFHANPAPTNITWYLGKLRKIGLFVPGIQYNHNSATNKRSRQNLDHAMVTWCEEEYPVMILHWKCSTYSTKECNTFFHFIQVDLKLKTKKQRLNWKSCFSLLQKVHCRTGLSGVWRRFNKTVIVYGRKCFGQNSPESINCMDLKISFLIVHYFWIPILSRMYADNNFKRGLKLRIFCPTQCLVENKIFWP
jgi:hypothetical protein